MCTSAHNIANTEHVARHFVNSRTDYCQYFNYPEGIAMPLMSIPIIDLSPYYTGDQEEKKAVAMAVDEACRDIGFLVITGHQVPKELVEQVDLLSRQFFDLPSEEKSELKRPKADQVRGYSAVSEEG